MYDIVSYATEYIPRSNKLCFSYSVSLPQANLGAGH